MTIIESLIFNSGELKQHMSRKPQLKNVIVDP